MVRLVDAPEQRIIVRSAVQGVVEQVKDDYCNQDAEQRRGNVSELARKASR